MPAIVKAARPHILELSAATVDLLRRTVTRADGEEHRLTGLETKLVQFLCRNPFADIPWKALLDPVWGQSHGSKRSVFDAMRRLRCKLEWRPDQPTHLLTVAGVGYRFVPAGRPSHFCVPEVRVPSDLPEVIPLASGFVDLNRRLISCENRQETLTQLEAGLLRALWMRPNQTLTRETLLTHVWGMDPKLNTRAVDAAVSRLRRKLGSGSFLLMSVRGEGYALLPNQTL